MNRWADWLADLPASLQRAIARHQRISLPRRCDEAARLARLRDSLCHARTVREVFFGQSPEVRAALQELRAQPRGLSAEALAARYGTLRAPSAILADMRPQSVAEQLLLLGWLLPRPATPRHPARYLLPPEVRAWLPRPITLATDDPTPSLTLPPALRMITVVLLACAEAPLPLCQNGTPRVAALRQLLTRLAPLDDTTVSAAAHLLLPLMADLGLISVHNGAAALRPGGQRFLDRPANDQIARLRDAWVAAPRPDRWLLLLLRAQRGITWPTFRRRLLAWVEALPVGHLLDPAGTYADLEASLGPLADPHTHWLSWPRRAARWDRSPWNRARAAEIWQAALRGPLTWLGLVVWSPDGARCGAPAPAPVDAPAPWRYGGPGEICIPHTTLCAGMTLLPAFMVWQEADAAQMIYRLDRRRMAQARARGEPLASLKAIIERQAGPSSEEWWGETPPAAPTIRLVSGVIAVADEPAQLDRAAQRRSVRRYLSARLAPGVALVAPDRADSLARTLQRADLVVRGTGGSGPPPAPLSPNECAALLELCDFYRRNGPAEAPISLVQLEDRLRAALPPDRQLSAAAHGPAAPLEKPAADSALGGDGQADASAWLPTVRRAIRGRHTLAISYAGADGPPTARSIRPLRLERHGEHWYLYAYCLARQAERCFRLDRVLSLSIEGGRGRRGDPEARAARSRPTD